MISDDERAILNTWANIANVWQQRAQFIHDMIERSFEQRSMKGFEPMPAFSWNTNGIDPSWGSPGGGLPVGKHPVIIYNSKLESTKAGTGGKMVLQCEVIDGPMKGVRGDINLTLQHENPVVVKIAGQQLTAICHVVGLPNGFQNATEELHDKPFVVDVAPQKEKPQYTEVVGVFDMQGNEPGAGGGNANNNAGNNNFGNNGANNGGNNNQNNNGGGNAGGGWGSGGAANQGGGNADQGANQQQGGNAGGAGGGWQQNGGGAAAGGGNGGWGAR